MELAETEGGPLKMTHPSSPESHALWERRSTIMETSYMVRRKDFADAMGIAEKLINYSEDLIHKAVGWMLREIGNRAPGVTKKFLTTRFKSMPRPMLCYAIEKFPEKERQKYLKRILTIQDKV